MVQHVSHEFIWIHKTVGYVTIFSWMITIALFSSRVTVRISGYAHVLVRLSL